MSEEQKKRMSNRDFQNYLRVLSSHSSSSLTIMGFTLTFLTAGFAGIFTLTTTRDIDKDKWHMALGVLMLCITLILSMVWLREKALGAKAVEDLEKSGVSFPQTPEWNRSTARMWKLVFALSTIFWAGYIGYALRGIMTAAAGQ